jgi:hypothetical protein
MPTKPHLFTKGSSIVRTLWNLQYRTLHFVKLVRIDRVVDSSRCHLANVRRGQRHNQNGSKCPTSGWIAQRKCLKLFGFGLGRDFWDRSLRWFLRGRAKVDFDFFYLVSFDSEEFRVRRAAGFLVFAVVDDDGFVAFFKQLLNVIGWGFLGIGPTPCEISSTVNAIVVWSGKYEGVGQKRLDGLALFVFVGGKVFCGGGPSWTFGVSKGQN